MEVNGANIISILSTSATAALTYFIRSKEKELNAVQTAHEALKTDHGDLEDRVTELEKLRAVSDEANKHRDERSERIESKLDKLLEKLGVAS